MLSTHRHEDDGCSLVCGSPGEVAKDIETEVWLNYYDIFVRNAFGNFRDVLAEVTYSLATGTSLTHTGSSSFDYNGRYPNGNYAREIQQLFTIGLFTRRPDGSVVRGQDGMPEPSHDNESILAFPATSQDLSTDHSARALRSTAARRIMSSPCA